MAVLTVLMVGTGSALYLTSNAVERPGDPLREVIKSSETADRLAEEVSSAMSFSLRTATAVEFLVADRNGDNNPELIRYEWSGTAGDPLLRQLNNGTALVAVDNVQEFGLTYVTRNEVTTEESDANVDSGELLFATFSNWSGLTPTVRDYALTNTAWASEYFTIDQLTIPAAAVNVRITRVEVKLKSAAGGPTVSAAIQRPTTTGGPLPQSGYVGSPAVISSGLLSGTYATVSFAFSDAHITGLGQEFVVVFRGSAPSGANLRYYYNKLAPTNTPVMNWTSNSGSAWSPPTRDQDEQDVPFSVYGRYETLQTANTNVTRYYQTSVGVALRSGPEASSRVQTAVAVVNEPEVPTP